MLLFIIITIFQKNNATASYIRGEYFAEYSSSFLLHEKNHWEGVASGGEWGKG